MVVSKCKNEWEIELYSSWILLCTWFPLLWAIIWVGLHNSGAWKLDSGITKGRSYVKLSSLRFVTFRGTHFRDFAVWGVSWWKARVVCFMAGWDLGLGDMALALSGLWAVGGRGGLLDCAQKWEHGARAPRLPRFILLVSFSYTVLVVSILDIWGRFGSPE